jgi:hypothetical protein
VPVATDAGGLCRPSGPFLLRGRIRGRCPRQGVRRPFRPKKAGRAWRFGAVGKREGRSTDWFRWLRMRAGCVGPSGLSCCGAGSRGLCPRQGLHRPFRPEKAGRVWPFEAAGKRRAVHRLVPMVTGRCGATVAACGGLGRQARGRSTGWCRWLRGACGAVRKAVRTAASCGGRGRAVVTGGRGWGRKLAAIPQIPSRGRHRPPISAEGTGLATLNDSPTVLGHIPSNVLVAVLGEKQGGRCCLGALGNGHTHVPVSPSP